jgi:nuclear GTP-binding protein
VLTGSLKRLVTLSPSTSLHPSLTTCFLPFFGPPHSQGGNPDLTAAARIVLRDWSTGKLSRYAVPPARSSLGTTTNVVSPMPTMIYAGDAALLERLTPRKELRRTGNLVRLSSEWIDDRALVLETPWINADASEGESDLDGEYEYEDENEGEMEKEAIGSGTDGADSVESAASDGLEAPVSEEVNDDDGGENADADEEDEDEGGDDVPPNTHYSSSVRKRKRRAPSTTPKQQSDPARPSKKVTFAAEVMPSNKRTPNPALPARRPVIVTHISKKQKQTPDLSRPSAATAPSSKRVNSGVQSAGGAPIRARKPAANAPMTIAAQKRKQATSSAGEAHAYDFSKYF